MICLWENKRSALPNPGVAILHTVMDANYLAMCVARLTALTYERSESVLRIGG